MTRTNTNEAMLDAINQVNESRLYLKKIPTLEDIDRLQSPQKINQEKFSDPSNTLAMHLKNLLKDEIGYRYNFKDLSYDNNQKGFFGFYNYAQKWLKFKCEDEKVYKDKLEELKLDEPYKLAIELFQAYIEFRTNSKYAKWKNGRNNKQGEYQPNIRDLFTDEDLIKLGGTKFIKDCYDLTDIKFDEDIAKKHHWIKQKPEIQHINSITGALLEYVEEVKPNLYKRVNKHLSWKIFKDRNVEDLTKNEISILEEAMKNEGFWKHFGKVELPILPFTVLIALLLCLIFEATGGALLALILIPIGVGALGIAPVAPISQKSAIVDNMIEIDKQNKEWNKEGKSEVDKYKQYKKDHPDFLEFLKPKSELEKKENIEKNIIDINNINLEQTNQITSEEDKSNEKINPFKIIGQSQNGQDNKQKEEKDGQDF